MKDYKKLYESALERTRIQYQKCIDGNNPIQAQRYVDIFPELKESDDERIRKEIINYIKANVRSDELCESWIAWLEKHGEQKPADKIEPKFKVGDWIVFNGLTLYVKEVVKGFYKTISKGGITNSYVWDIDNAARLWTIQDAKDGDVLVDGNLPFIFKKIDSNKYCYAYCGISVDDGFKIESEGKSGEWTWMQDIKPATKEQRDTLLKAMTDAGYTFDFEKKELKKIEQNPAWSDEDENILRTIISDGIRGAEFDMLQIDWLKSLKERVQPQTKQKWSEEDETTKNNISHIIRQYDKISKRNNQPCYYVGDCLLWMQNVKDRIQPQLKREWSEEDEKMLNDAISAIGIADYYTYDDKQEIENWLKSLKNRVQPQKTWKPSDEQMKQLGWIAKQNKDNMIGKELMSLYQDLKKLREE